MITEADTCRKYVLPKLYDADPFDLLIHVPFNAPLRSRRERAEAVRREHKDFFDTYSSQARQVLDYLLDKYTDYGESQLTDLHILELTDVPVRGTVIEIADLFGGIEELKEATASCRISSTLRE